MSNDVQIVSGSAEQTEGDDYVRVRTSSDPVDETITLATIERVVAKAVRKQKDPPWRVKTLIAEQPMSLDAALGLATCYAKRKQIPVVYTPGEAGQGSHPG